MATWGTFIGGIRLKFKQAFDDAEIRNEEIAQWAIIAADRLNLLHSQKISSGMLSTTFVVDILEDATLHRRYVELPGRIFDMDFDAGIARMSYWTDDDTSDDAPRFLQVIGFRTNSVQAHVMNGHRDQRASSREFQYYRDGNKRVYLLSVDPLITKMEIELRMACPDIKDIKLDEEMRIDPALMLILERNVLDLGRLAFSMPGTKLSNDGAERLLSLMEKPAPGARGVSVNAPEINEQNG